MLFVRRCDEDHLVILELGKLCPVGTQMADEANLRPEESLAKRTGNGGSCCRVAGSVFPGLSAVLGNSDPVGLAYFGTLMYS